MPASRATWPRGHVLRAIPCGLLTGLLTSLLMGLLVGLLPACFNPPADAVMFACTPEAPDCPADYTCADDGCCHRDGSDIAANYGACGLGGPATGPLPTGTSTGTDASTTGTTSEQPGTTASGTSSTDAGSTSASTGS